jgi:eukaryotic-like serine/threonine-protein kinase
MSLLEGQTLRDQIAARAVPFPTDELLNLAIQIGDGLAAAHEKGIIHRDIKPANIFITNRNEAKILDFGLAKLTGAGDGGIPHEETQNASVHDLSLSLTGVAMGTAPYMSPEQVRGEKLDARTDLFSSGLVLYEMATGKQAFSGNTAPELHEAILNRTPIPALELNPELPPGLAEIINRALEKDRNLRYQSAAEMQADLQRLKTITARPNTIASRGAKFVGRHRDLTVGALVLLVLIGGLSVIRRREVSKPRPEPQSNVIRKQLTANSSGDPVIAAAISRDGKYLAYSDTAWRMYLLQIASEEVRQLPSSDFLPLDWFPDGNHLLVNGRGRHSGLWKMAASDGICQKLFDSFVDVAAVSPNGSYIAYQKRDYDHAIWLMGANGQDARRIAQFSSADYIDSFAWSPGGQRLVYMRHRGEYLAVLETCDLQGGQRTLVLSEPGLWDSYGTSSLYWLPDGRILYTAADFSQSQYADHNILAMATDPGSGKTTGPPERLTNGVRYARNFQASADGERLTYISMIGSDAIYLGNLEPGANKFNPRRLTLEEWHNWPFDWTRDSKAVLFGSSRQGGRYAILQQRIDEQPRKSCFLVLAQRFTERPYSVRPVTGCCIRRQRQTTETPPSSS